MIRITLTLTGALAALAFSAATAHADPDEPTPLGPEFDLTNNISIPWLDEQLLYHEDFSVLNAPAETFEGAAHSEYAEFGSGLYHPTIENYNVSVEQDMAGNVPLGEVQRLQSRRRLGRGLQQHRRHAGGVLHHAVR